MISKRALVLAVTCGLASATTVAVMVGYKPIDAEFQITGANTTDPATNQRMDRVALFLSGDGARSIYDVLAVPEENGEICEDGMRLKKLAGVRLRAAGDGGQHGEGSERHRARNPRAQL